TLPRTSTNTMVSISPLPVFPKSEMRPVLVVITNVIFEQLPQVSLIENDHVVEQVSTYAPDPALRHPVLPRTAKGGAHGLSARVFHCRKDIGTEFRITIEDEESVGSFETPIFAQLQDDPEGIRLPSYVAVQDLPPVVLFTHCHTTSDGCVLISKLRR